MIALYNLFLALFFLLISPKLIWQALRANREKKTILSRLKQTAPTPPQNSCVIWLHGVSVGEVKALSTLVLHIRKTHPLAFIVVSTVTKTGQDEAKRLIKQADAFCYLPLDVPWIIRRFVKQLHPRLLILVEGDFWFHLLRAVKNQRGHVALVNGKMSEKSFRRYSLVKWFAKSLFQNIDLFCIQSPEHLKRFLHFGVQAGRTAVIGNLKYDVQIFERSDSEIRAWKKQLNLQSSDFILTVGSTGKGEEALLLTKLMPIWNQYPHLKLLLVPRHPERFHRVKEIVQKRNIPCISYSAIRHQKGNEKLILIDAMGLLPLCYQVAHLTIVGGSFIPGMQGHNILEPVQLGKPVFFGPHMESQKELAHILLQLGVAKQISIDKLSLIVQDYIRCPALFKECEEKGKKFAKQVMGSSHTTWESIKSLVDDTN